MMKLLDKIRNINKLIEKSGIRKISFDELAKILCDLTNSNIYIINKTGKLLEHSYITKETRNEEKFTEVFNDELMKMTETSENLNDDKIIINAIDKKYITVVPVYGGNNRIGTLILSRDDEKYNDDDIILAEYIATILGIELLKSKNDILEEEERKRSIVQMALGTLSYSELEAVIHIFDELNGNEGLLVASKIADKVGITRSVIVNALRKFESAGVIESRSLGMKGTHIKILNDKLIDELNKLKR